MSEEDELKRKVWREVQRERREKIAKAKTGRKVKGAEIVDGFNLDKTIQPSRKDLRDAGIDVNVNVDEDAQSAYQMLQFLRYAFRNSKGTDGKKGKERLVKLMESDSEFKFFVRELAKIETSLLAAKIRKTGDESGGVNNNFFVVLKGLEEDKKILEMTDKDVDMKQIARAMNPDGTEME